MSTRPKSFRIFSHVSPTCLPSATSTTYALPAIVPAVASTFASVRPQHATRAPSLASFSAMALPMPRPAPLTTATLFSSKRCIFLHRSGVADADHFHISVDPFHQAGQNSARTKLDEPREPLRDEPLHRLAPTHRRRDLPDQQVFDFHHTRTGSSRDIRDHRHARHFHRDLVQLSGDFDFRTLHQPGM